MVRYLGGTLANITAAETTATRVAAMRSGKRGNVERLKRLQKQVISGNANAVSCDSKFQRHLHRRAPPDNPGLRTAAGAATRAPGRTTRTNL